MLVGLITDSHFGWKNDSILFADYFKRFYDGVFFPELRRRGITTILNLGDLFERRKFVNFQILQRTRVDFLEKLTDYETHILCGNHDVYYRTENSVNALRELVHGRYPNITIYEEPQEIVIDKLKILLVPWLNPSNIEAGLEMIAKSTATVLMGHLEIAGFKMDTTQVSEHGLDRNIFAKFKKVFSGHFHHASEDGPIKYLGAPYQYTFADLNDPKGFYIFDTNTLELEFIENPEQMFFRVVYDDRDPEAEKELMAMDFSRYENKMLRVVVPYKNNPVLYDQWIDAVNNANPAELVIKEQLSLEMDAEVDEQFEEFKIEGGQVIMSDTLTVLNTYVDALGMDVDKNKLKAIMGQLYSEAVAEAGSV